MDAVSGITPMGLCSVAVTSVGSKINDGAGAALNMATINNGIQKNYNSFIPSVVSSYDGGINLYHNQNIGNLKKIISCTSSAKK